MKKRNIRMDRTQGIDQQNDAIRQSMVTQMSKMTYFLYFLMNAVFVAVSICFVFLL